MPGGANCFLKIALILVCWMLQRLTDQTSDLLQSLAGQLGFDEQLLQLVAMAASQYCVSLACLDLGLSIHHRMRRRTGHRPTKAELALPRAAHLSRGSNNLYHHFAERRRDNGLFKSMTRFHIHEIDALLEQVTSACGNPLRTAPNLPGLHKMSLLVAGLSLSGCGSRPASLWQAPLHFSTEQAAFGAPPPTYVSPCSLALPYRPLCMRALAAPCNLSQLAAA